MSAPASSVNDAEDTRSLPGAWFVVALLWMAGCLNYLDRVMLNTMRDSIKAAIPMDDKSFGWLMTGFLLVYGLLSPLGGWCADRFGRSRIILLSLGGWSAVTVATSFVQTYEQLLVTRLLLAVCEVCYIPAALALIADYHRGSTRSLANGIHMTGIYAGIALGSMGAWMAANYGWFSGFRLFGCIGLALALVLTFFLRDVSKGHHANAGGPPVRVLETLKTLGRNPNMWLITLHWGLLGFAGWAFMTWMPTFLRERHHLSETEAGFTANIYTQLAALSGVLIGGALADRWSRTQIRGRLRVPMIALTLASPFVFMNAHADVLWFAIICLLAFGFAQGCSDANMMPILCQVAAPQHRATGYGVLNFFGCCVGGMAPVLGGWLKDANMDLSYLLVIASVGVMISGLLLAAVKPVRH